MIKQLKAIKEACSDFTQPGVKWVLNRLMEGEQTAQWITRATMYADQCARQGGFPPIAAEQCSDQDVMDAHNFDPTQDTYEVVIHPDDGCMVLVSGTTFYGDTLAQAKQKAYDAGPAKRYPALEVNHEGMCRYRLKDSLIEQKLANTWQHINATYCTLDWLVGHTDENGQHCGHATQEQATMAATVIQWLGTPVGRQFLQEVGFEYTGEHQP